MIKDEPLRIGDLSSKLLKMVDDSTSDGAGDCGGVVGRDKIAGVANSTVKNTKTGKIVEKGSFRGRNKWEVVRKLWGEERG